MNKKWRPDGWENPYYQEDGGHLKSGEDKYCYNAYEAGADAMLEVLRGNGLHDAFYKNKNHEVSNKSGRPLYIPVRNVPLIGTVIFIPDEETK